MLHYTPPSKYRTNQHRHNFEESMSSKCKVSDRSGCIYPPDHVILRFFTSYNYDCNWLHIYNIYKIIYREIGRHTRTHTHIYIIIYYYVYCTCVISMIVFTFLCQVRRLRHLFQVVQPRHLQRWFVLCQVGPYTKLNKLLVYKRFLTFTCFFLAFPCFSRLFHIFPVFSMLFVAFTCFSMLFLAFLGFSMFFMAFRGFSWLVLLFHAFLGFSSLFHAFLYFSMFFLAVRSFSWLCHAFPVHTNFMTCALDHPPRIEKIHTEAASK